MSLEKSVDKIFLALNHPLRRWIIELLEDHRTLSHSELRSLLNINPGRLCYHLENLGGLIEQDKNQQYILSVQGKRAYRQLLGSRRAQLKF